MMQGARASHVLLTETAKKKDFSPPPKKVRLSVRRMLYYLQDQTAPAESDCILCLKQHFVRSAPQP